MKKNEEKIDLFDKLKRELLNLDPVNFCQHYLTLDGEPFSLSNNGYKPFVDIYRYIGIKALEINSKPVIMVKGRQVGGTTLACALELYFTCSGSFGNGVKPPVRIIHAFPQNDMATKYTKEKLNPMINTSATPGGTDHKGQPKAYIQSLLDHSSDANNSLGFKQFVGGNFIRIDSTGLDGKRLRGGTADIIFYDECLPYDQFLETESGKEKIGKLTEDFLNNISTPLIKTFNEKTEEFEFKKIVNAWERGKRKLVQIFFDNTSIKCTGNHRFLTEQGWIYAEDLDEESILKTVSGQSKVDKVLHLHEEFAEVYDLEIEDNHNFILEEGLIAHNCQDIPGDAIGTTVEMLKQAKYGRQPGGVQVYFGTPKKKGSDFHKMWLVSNQQYYYLGCERCKQYFPLYTPESDEWKNIWIHGHIVKCPKCKFEQNKLQAAERGKWIGTQDINDPDVKFVGFHINQFYMPKIKREDIDEETPGKHPTNTERKFKNEVLGEFYSGDATPISIEEIIELCGDRERKMRPRIEPGSEEMVLMGIDYGARADLEQLAKINHSNRQGSSYTTAVILSVKGPNLFHVELGLKFQRNDPESKKGIIDNLLRQYSVDLCIGDIGFSNDFSYNLQVAYGDKYLVSRASAKLNDKARFYPEMMPKEIKFERDYYIGEMFDILKKGQIRFPLGDYDKIAWLINHCTSMELKPSISKFGDPSIHYVKGSIPNDGFMALLNAYLAYKFLLTKGFSVNNPHLQQDFKTRNKPLAVIGYVPRRF